MSAFLGAGFGLGALVIIVDNLTAVFCACTGVGAGAGVGSSSIIPRSKLLNAEADKKVLTRVWLWSVV